MAFNLCNLEILTMDLERGNNCGEPRKLVKKRIDDADVKAAIEFARANSPSVHAIVYRVTGHTFWYRKGTYDELREAADLLKAEIKDGKKDPKHHNEHKTVIFP
jgi:hypothetical protein